MGEVLYLLSKAIYDVRDGVSQIIFVTRGRFTGDEIDTFHVFRDVIFGPEMTKFTTIVVTDVPTYRDTVKCAIRLEKLKAESDQHNEIFSSCNVIQIYTPNEESRVPHWKEIREHVCSQVLLPLIGTWGQLYTPPSLSKVECQIKKHVEAADSAKLEKARMLAEIEVQKGALAAQQQSAQQIKADMTHQAEVHAQQTQHAKAVSEATMKELEIKLARVEVELNAAKQHAAAVMAQIAAQGRQKKRGFWGKVASVFGF
jgi:hypothetical protein